MTHQIQVRYYGGAYIARCGGKTASCTAGPEQAARSCIAKLGIKHCDLHVVRSAQMRVEYHAVSADPPTP